MITAEQLVTFDQAFQIVRPSKVALKQRDYLLSGRFPVVDQGAALIGGYSDDENLVIEVDSPLIVFGDHTRCVKWVDFDFVIGADGTKILKPLNSLDPKFAYLLLLSKELPSKGYARHFALLRKVLFWVPQLEVQKKILEALEEHLSRLDKALGEVLEAKGQLTQQRRALLRDAFDGTLTAEPRTQTTNDLPRGWEAKRLDEVAKVTMGQSPPGSSYNTSGSGVPFFQGKAEFGLKHPTIRKWTTAGTKFADAGDILMSVRAPVGPTNIADVDCSIGRGLAAIKSDPKQVLQTYLVWYLKYIQSAIESRGKGSTFDAISGNELRETLLSVPPIEVQKRIVETLEEHLYRLDRTAETLNEVENAAKTLRRSLLNAAFTGQLANEEPND